MDGFSRRSRREESGHCLARTVAQQVDHGNAVDAAYSAIRRAGLDRGVFAFEIRGGVLLERHGRIASLLRTVVNEPILADIQIPASRAALPLIGLAGDEILLEEIVVGKGPEPGLALALNLLIDGPVSVRQGTQLSVVIVNRSDRGIESEFEGAPRDGERIFRVAYAGSDDGIDADIETGILGKPFKLLVEHLQTLFRDLIRLHVVDADLQVLQASPIQLSNALRSQKISVRDKRRNAVMAADTPNQFVKIRVKQRLTPAERNDLRPKRGEKINAMPHLRRGHRVGGFVVLIAVGAGEIATADRNDMRKDRVTTRFE